MRTRAEATTPRLSTDPYQPQHPGRIRALRDRVITRLQVLAPKSDQVAQVLPRWIVLVDWLTVALVLFAVCIFEFGGFREEVAGIYISMTNWGRLAIAAAALTAIRHVYVPTPAMPIVCGQQAIAFWRSEARRAVWPAFLSTRLTVLLVGYLAVVTFGIAPGIERFRISRNELGNLLARWDVEWYFHIVTGGYQWDGNALRQQSVVFFPAFPILTRAVGLFIGKQFLVAGLLVALTSFLVALLYFYRLARDFMDAERAKVAVWTLAAYPFAAYYSVPYTEALYLLCSVLAFYHVSRTNWWRAAASGYVLGLCRPNGFLIALPLGILALEYMIRQRRVVANACAAVVAPVAGILTYCLFLYIRFGDPLVWRKGQLAWGRTYVGVWEGARALWTDRYDMIAHAGFYQYSLTNPYDFMYCVAALFVLASVIPTVRRFGLAYGVFTLVNVLPPLLIGGMMSIGRMTSVLFPAFLWLGATLPPRYVPALIAAFCTVQGLVAALFFSWRPIF